MDYVIHVVKLATRAMNVTVEVHLAHHVRRLLRWVLQIHEFLVVMCQVDHVIAIVVLVMVLLQTVVIILVGIRFGRHVAIAKAFAI